MTWRITNPRVGMQRIADTSTTQQHPLGTIVQAQDDTYGTGEFIYLKGVANTVVGSWVTYDIDSGATVILVADAIGQVAVAMSANVASQYGWYQINGYATAKATTASGSIADSANLYVTSTAGEVDDVIHTGDRIWGAKAAGINTTLGFVPANINRPFVNDAVNAGTS